MRNLVAIFIILTSISCVSNQYNVAEHKGNFNQIQAGTKYAVYDFNNHETVIDVTSIEKDSIVGTHKKQMISIAKKDIKDIDKIKTGATIALVGSGITVIGITWWLVDLAKTASETIGVIISGNP